MMPKSVGLSPKCDDNAGKYWQSCNHVSHRFFIWLSSREREREREGVVEGDGRGVQLHWVQMHHFVICNFSPRICDMALTFTCKDWIFLHCVSDLRWLDRLTIIALIDWYHFVHIFYDSSRWRLNSKAPISCQKWLPARSLPQLSIFRRCFVKRWFSEKDFWGIRRSRAQNFSPHPRFFRNLYFSGSTKSLLTLQDFMFSFHKLLVLDEQNIIGECWTVHTENCAGQTQTSWWAE